MWLINLFKTIFSFFSKKPTDAPVVVAPAPVVQLDPTNRNWPALSWEKDNPSRATWSGHLQALVESLLSSFEKAADIKRFRPDYEFLSHEQRVAMWAEMIVKISYFESSWKPALHYGEPPPLGYDSIGLLQLSYEDTQYAEFCELDRKAKSLEDPIKNLSCGVKIMAKLVAKYGAISTPSNKGAAAYWSVLREGHKIDEIATHVKSIKFG